MQIVLAGWTRYDYVVLLQGNRKVDGLSKGDFVIQYLCAQIFHHKMNPTYLFLYPNWDCDPRERKILLSSSYYSIPLAFCLAPSCWRNYPYGTWVSDLLGGPWMPTTVFACLFSLAKSEMFFLQPQRHQPPPVLTGSSPLVVSYFPEQRTPCPAGSPHSGMCRIRH